MLDETPENPRFRLTESAQFQNSSERQPTKSPSLMKSFYELGRFGKPIGNWFIYFPCIWGIAMAAPPGQLPDVYMLALFGVICVVIRSSGCTINDVLDQKYDRLVERTKGRPLASGSITNCQALLFFGLQLLVLFVLLLQLGWYSVLIGFLLMVPATIYPLFKRFTYWPQLFLGLTVNWGAIMAYAATVGYFNLSITFPLYLAGVNWTVIYDTIYAYQDIDDDIRIGVKSTAILFGEKTKSYLVLFHTGMTVCFLTAGINAGAGWIYYLGTLCTLLHIANMIRNVDLKNPASCLQTFGITRTSGLLFSLTIVLDNIFG
ncbi:unnamed protein product [Trichobilharzia szidati]|nr:unnamed protein product [Trichobilharzia szidati]